MNHDRLVGPMRLAAALALPLFAIDAVAHHSTAGIYNEDEVVEIRGSVKEWRFVNPHPSLIIEVEADGQIQEWDVSYGGPAVTHLRQRGYTETTFSPGDVVVARGYAAKVQTAFGLLIMGDPVAADGSPIVPGTR